jgi:hypothetical protein
MRRYFRGVQGDEVTVVARPASSRWTVGAAISRQSFGGGQMVWLGSDLG